VERLFAFLMSLTMLHQLARHLSADRADFALEIANAGFARVVLDNRGDAVIGKFDLFRLETVCLRLLAYQVALRNFELLSLGVSGQAENLEAVLELAGYTEEEKLKIAIEHLIAKQVTNHGLSAETVEFTEKAIRTVIRGYTREAGVRNLEREIGALCRKVARRRAEGDESRIVITEEIVVEMLGAPTFLDEEIEDRTKDPGVAVGLAWTPSGGEVLFVEASRMQGGGSLTLTGHLGDVMKESARTALSWFRAHAQHYGVNPEFYKDAEIHLHVPSGAIPKDGPSAGVTMVTALASELTGRPVRGDVAMTGEITLSGRVLPVGGIKEKVLAARRLGITEVILPRQNEKNIKEDLTEDLRAELTIHYVVHIEEVTAIALRPSATQTHTGLPLDDEIRQTVQ